MALLEGGGIYEGYREDSEEVGCFYCHKTRDGKGRTPVIMWMGGPSKVNGTRPSTCITIARWTSAFASCATYTRVNAGATTATGYGEHTENKHWEAKEEGRTRGN